MGIKTTIGNQGVVSTEVAGAGSLVINATMSTVTKTAVTAVSESGNVTIGSQPVVVMEPNGLGVTASLPAVSDALVGTEFLVLNAGAGSGDDVLVSGSNNIDGGTWTTTLTSGFDTLRLLAVSSSLNGYYWHTT